MSKCGKSFFNLASLGGQKERLTEAGVYQTHTIFWPNHGDQIEGSDGGNEGGGKASDNEQGTKEELISY